MGLTSIRCRRLAASFDYPFEGHGRLGKSASQGVDDSPSLWTRGGPARRDAAPGRRADRYPPGRGIRFRRQLIDALAVSGWPPNFCAIRPSHPATPCTSRATATARRIWPGLSSSLRCSADANKASARRAVTLWGNIGFTPVQLGGPGLCRDRIWRACSSPGSIPMRRA